MTAMVLDKGGELQDLLLTMDVVDELRHREIDLEQAAEKAHGIDAIKRQLLEIYESQGIEVSEHVLNAGLQARADRRFVYIAPTGVVATLARAWIGRRAIATAGALAISVCAIGLTTHHGLVVMPRERAVAEALAALNAEALALPARVSELRVQLAAATEQVALARADAAQTDGHERLSGLVETAVTDAREAGAKAEILLSALAGPAPTPLTRADYERRAEPFRARLIEDRQRFKELHAALRVVSGAAGRILSATAVSARLEAAHREVSGRRMSAVMRAERDEVYARGSAALSAGDVAGAQAAADELTRFSGLFAEIETLAAQADDLLERGSESKPDPDAAIALKRAHQAVRDALTPSRLGNARAAASDLGALVDVLTAEYTYRIVSRPNKPAAVRRRGSTGAATYYAIVEAIDGTGRAATLPVLNEETGARETVSMFGVRISEAEFQQIAADKKDNAMVDNDVVGHKARGSLTPTFTMPVYGGYITRW